MFSFFRKNPSLDEKYLKSLAQADGVWSIDESPLFTEITLDMKDERFQFQKFQIPFYARYVEKVGGKSRDISEKLYTGIQKIAQEYISYHRIHTLGGYILDPDLAEAIHDAKRITSAEKQVKLLTDMVEHLRDKKR